MQLEEEIVEMLKGQNCPDSMVLSICNEDALNLNKKDVVKSLSKYVIGDLQEKGARSLASETAHKLTRKDFIPYNFINYSARNAIHGNTSSWKFMARLTLLEGYNLAVTAAGFVGAGIIYSLVK